MNRDHSLDDPAKESCLDSMRLLATHRYGGVRYPEGRKGIAAIKSIRSSGPSVGKVGQRQDHVPQH